MDKRLRGRLLEALMDQPKRKLVTPASLAVDAVLVAAFFLYMYGVVSGHVPSKDHRMVLFWGAMCSGCLSAVFWLALQMIRVVASHQRAISRH
jgi:hypothetical protein